MESAALSPRIMGHKAVFFMRRICFWMLIFLAVLLAFCGCAQKLPVIYAPDAHICPGESYDMDDGVHALDAQDGDISSKIVIISGQLDTQKQGRYRIRYEVTNSRGYTVKASRIITVSSRSPAVQNTILLIALAAGVLLVFCILLFLLRKRRRCTAARICAQ